MALVPVFETVEPWRFNGSTSIITIPNSKSQDLLAQSGMVGCRILADTFTTQYLFSTADASATNGIRFLVTNSGTQVQLGFGAASSGAATEPHSFVAAASELFPYGTYADVAFSWDGTVNAGGTRMSTGVNGEMMRAAFFDTDDAGSGSVQVSGQALNIGNRPGLARPVNGDIFYVARWSRVLVNSEFRKAQEFSPLMVPDGLVFYWANGREWINGLNPSAVTAIGRGASSAYSRPIFMGYKPVPSAAAGFNAAWNAAANTMIQEGARSA